ncbi:MAG TPA: hypothetical protein VJ997_00270, partial [Longimicrobiales bacterium]|nr:hypothetical protein [Longimicrobiales bacterium]
MKRPLLLVLFLTLGTLLPRGVAVGLDGPAVGGATPLDSARDELRVGRAWHAARILRAQGAATSTDPALVLLLARADAG